MSLKERIAKIHEKFSKAPKVQVSFPRELENWGEAFNCFPEMLEIITQQQSIIEIQQKALEEVSDFLNPFETKHENLTGSERVLSAMEVIRSTREKTNQLMESNDN